MKRSPAYCRIIVIPHGESEMILAKSIKSNLRLPMGFLGDKSSAVQVTSILNFFAKYNSHKKFAEAITESEVELAKGKMCNVRIFPIIDLDDCSSEMAESYKNGQLFKDCIFRDYIIPIYNSPNLDDVMKKAGYEIDTKKKTRSYNRAFPGENGDQSTFNNLCNNITKIDSKFTNLNIFLHHCLPMIKA